MSKMKTFLIFLCAFAPIIMQFGMYFGEFDNSFRVTVCLLASLLFIKCISKQYEKHSETKIWLLLVLATFTPLVMKCCDYLGDFSEACSATAFLIGLFLVIMCMVKFADIQKASEASCTLR